MPKSAEFDLRIAAGLSVQVIFRDNKRGGRWREWAMGQFRFKEHRLSEPALVWVKEAVKPDFNPKGARVRLWNLLPEDFDPKSIDRRFYVNDRLTPLGTWVANADHPIFEITDRVAKAVRHAIIENPDRDQIAAGDIAQALEITPEQAGEALYFLGELGGFFGSASGKTGAHEYFSIHVGREDVQARYLRYKNIEDELERYYVERGHPAYLNPNLMFLPEQTTTCVQTEPARKTGLWGLLGQVYSRHEASIKAAALVIGVLGGLATGGRWAWEHFQDTAPDVHLRLINPTRPAVVLENVSDTTASQIKSVFAFVKINGPEIGQVVPIPATTFDFLNGRMKGGPGTLFDFPGLSVPDGQKLFGWMLVTCPTCPRARYYYAYINLGHDGWYSEVSQERHEEIARQLKERGPYDGDDVGAEKVQSVIAPSERIKIGVP